MGNTHLGKEGGVIDFDCGMSHVLCLGETLYLTHTITERVFLILTFKLHLEPLSEVVFLHGSLNTSHLALECGEGLSQRALLARELSVGSVLTYLRESEDEEVFCVG